MTIDHKQLASELEVKFVDRFTDKDDDYARSLRSRKIEPPCIYPWYAPNWRRDGFNNQYNNRRFHQRNQQQHNAHRSNQNDSHYDQAADHKKRRHD